MAVLDTGAERLLEPDRIVHVESVHMGEADPAEASVFVVPSGGVGGSEIGMAVVLVGTPRLVEIVFGAGSMGGAGPGFSVYHEHVVSLAVPHGARVVDVIVHSGKVAGALYFAEQVVVFVGRVESLSAENSPLVLDIAELALGLGQFLVVPSVKSAQVLGERLVLFIVDIVVERVDVEGALIFKLDAGAVAERHGEIADEGFAFSGSGGEGEGGVVVVFAPALAEELSDWGLDAGVLLAVPKHSEDEVAAGHRVLASDGDPDVLDDSGAGDIGQNGGGSGGDLNVVTVPTAAVVAGDSLASCVNDGGNVGERALAHG